MDAGNPFKPEVITKTIGFRPTCDHDGLPSLPEYPDGPDEPGCLVHPKEWHEISVEGDDPLVEFDERECDDYKIRKDDRESWANSLKIDPEPPYPPEDKEYEEFLVAHEEENERVRAERVRLLEEWKSVPAAPATVLDPFAGSGTVGAVARRLGRSSLLIELKEEYAELARKRCRLALRAVESFAEGASA